MTKRRRHVVLCAGGTGGHLFPAIAAGQALLRMRIDVDITVATDKVALDEERFRLLPLAIPRRTHSWMLPFFAAALIFAFFKCLFVFLMRRPALVVGFGGYPSVPAVLAAQVLCIPTMLHEQNATLGLANRLLLKRSKLLALSFKKTRGIQDSAAIPKVVTGNPVRFTADKSYANGKASLHLLVIGGSQGAAHFSTLIPGAFALLSEEERLCFTLTMQCRSELLYKTTAAFTSLGMNPVLEPFFKDMKREYEKADFIISRAGASTVSEVATMGRAALFLPYPFATNDHQYHNAKALGDGCFLHRQKEFTHPDLATLLRQLRTEPHIMMEKAAAIHIYSMANASTALAKVVQDLLPT